MLYLRQPRSLVMKRFLARGTEANCTTVSAAFCGDPSSDVMANSRCPFSSMVKNQVGTRLSPASCRTCAAYKKNGGEELISPPPYLKVGGLNSFRGRRSARKGVRTGRFFIRSAIDFHGTLKVGAVFDHDPRGGEVAVNRPILLDLDAIFSPEIALHRAINHNFTRDNVRGNFGACADSQLPLIQRDQSFDRAVDQQIFIAGNLALNMQTGAEPRSRSRTVSGIS